MRNLKKVLALVLSLVMALSMVTMASAYTATPGTSFKDDASITEFDEAIQVLKGLEVLQGRADGNLDPNAVITRAEAATIIYRAITGDVDGSDLPMFADDQFSDVKVGDWFAGAVSYASNHGIIKGYEDGTFRPNDSVTGYQAMAILLRALGYDNGNGFTGGNWQSETAKYGTLTGVSNTINNAALRKPASRAVVAELTFRSIAKTSMVKSNAFGTNEPMNLTKGYEIFGLYGDPTVEKVGTDAGGNDVIGHIAQMTTVASLTGATTYTTDALAKMTNRRNAEIDLTAEVYGAPVAKWYIDTDRNGAYFAPGTVGGGDNGDGVAPTVAGALGNDVRANNFSKSKGVDSKALDKEIIVLFNPAETYKASVTTGTVYADAVKAGAKAVSNTVTLWSNNAITNGNGHVVDGVLQNLSTTDDAGDATDATISKTGTETILHSGKGVQTDLYVVPSVVPGEDARTFLTSRYTYAAAVRSNTLSPDGKTRTLTFTVAEDRRTAADPAALANAVETYTVVGTAADFADMAKGDVVIYTKYGVDADITAIKDANDAGEAVELTAFGDGTTALAAPMYLDADSVKEPSKKVVEVTNSYIPHKHDVSTGYFRTAEGKFEYDASYGAMGTQEIVSAAAGVVGGHSLTNWVNLVDADLKASGEIATDNTTINKDAEVTDLMLDREELLKARWTEQDVYFDDFGYVVYSERAGSVRGYMVLTEGTYAAKDRDNLFYGNYAGYDANGAAFSISGGWLTSYYNTQAQATDGLALNQGIYFYEKDVTGKYKLDSNEATNDPTNTTGNVNAAGTGVLNTDDEPTVFTAMGAKSADENYTAGTYNAYLKDKAEALAIDTILAGDVDALVDGTTNGADDEHTWLLDDNTVFVVAEYNQYGAITGYKTYKGIKNIPDLMDGEYVGANGVRVPFVAHYTPAVDNDSAIDLVMVLGAVSYADSVETLSNKEVFFLADLTPDEKFTEFDRHDVFKAGQAGTLDFVNLTIRNSDGITYNAPVDTNLLSVYTIEARRGGLVSRIAEPVVGTYATQAKWAGENMIASAAYFGFDGVEGTPGTDEALDNGYIVLADDCKIFLLNTTLGTTKELTKAQVSAVPAAGDAGKDARKTAIDGNDTVYVGEYNQYGFAKILYVVINENP